MSDAHPQVTALLARFNLETKIEAIPQNVRREGIRSLVNIIGCALGGSRHHAVNRAWAALQPFAGGEQVPIGRSQRTDALTAAFINTLSCATSMRSTIPMPRQSCIRADRLWPLCSQLPLAISRGRRQASDIEKTGCGGDLFKCVPQLSYEESFSLIDFADS
jgi:hypothetical protein